MSKLMSFDDYWQTVIGCDAARCAAEFDLVPGPRHSLSEWLGEAESIAWSSGRLVPLPDDLRADYHSRAVDMLDAAVNGGAS